MTLLTNKTTIDMIKTFILATASLTACTAAFAQQGKQMLTSVEEKNIGDYWIEYAYNADGTLHYLESTDEYGTSNKLFNYNDAGQVVSIDFAAWNGFAFEPYSYVEYKYNDKGLLEWRRNWNFDDNGNKKDFYDAEIRNSYDEDGNLLYKVTYLYMENVADYVLMDSTTYTYSNGRLGRMDCYNKNGGLSSYYIYEYDARGDLEAEINYNTPYGTAASAETYSKREYQYDRSGNLKRLIYYLGTSMGGFNMPQDSTEYFYDESVSIDDVVYPVDPEETKNFENYLKSKIEGYSVYSLEEMDMKLSLTQVYEYTYEDFRPTSVKSIEVAKSAEPKVFVSGGTAFVLGFEDKDADYVIYDLSGRVVMSGKMAHGTVDVYGLHDGYYVLSVGDNNIKFRK